MVDQFEFIPNDGNGQAMWAYLREAQELRTKHFVQALASIMVERLGLALVVTEYGDEDGAFRLRCEAEGLRLALIPFVGHDEAAGIVEQARAEAERRYAQVALTVG